MLAHGAMVIVPLLWAGNTIFGRAFAGQATPFALAFWRWFIALVIVLPFGWRRVVAQRAAVRAGWPRLALLALTSVTGYNALLYTALRTTTAINATLVASATPVFIALLVPWMLRERVVPLQLVGVAVSLAGVLVVVSRASLGVLLALQMRTGDGVMLLAALSWALYSVLLRQRPTGLDPMAYLTVQIAFGLALFTPVYAADVWLHGPGLQLNLPLAAGLLYVGIFPSVIAYGLFNVGVQRLGPTIAGQYNHLLPVFTAVLATAWLGETLRWFHATGFALILAGIWCTQAGRAPPPRP